MLKLFSSLFILVSWINSDPIQAAPFHSENLKTSDRVLILPGDYDPWSKTDLEYVTSLLEKGKYDSIIVLPVNGNPSELPLPVSNRLKLMDVALRKHPKILYPAEEQSVDQLIKKVRDSKAQVVLPSGVKTRLKVDKYTHINPKKSDPNIREFLSANSDVYFSSTNKKPEWIDDSVFKKITEDGLYLGRKPSNGMFMRNVMNFTVNTARKFGMWDQVRDLAVKLSANPNLKSFVINGKEVPITKYLASGLNGDAYVIDVDGSKTVLKVAKNRQNAKESLHEASLVYEWLKKTSGIKTPELISLGKNGEWQLLEMVKGKQLDKWIAERGGHISFEMEERLRSFYKDAHKLNQTSAVKLDISGDNIFVSEKDGRLVLVDFGPLPAEQTFAKDFEAARANWMSAARRLPEFEERKLKFISCMKIEFGKILVR